MEQEIDDKALLNALEESGTGLEIRTILDFVWRLKWWMLLCLCITLPAGHIYVKHRTPVYTVSSKAAFVETRPAALNFPTIKSFADNATISYVKDEMLRMRSPLFMANVVDSLGLNIRCYRLTSPEGGQGAGETEYYKDAPFSFHVVFDTETAPSSVEVEFETHGNGHLKILAVRTSSGLEDLPGGVVASYGDDLKFSCGTFAIGGGKVESMPDGIRFRAVYTSPLEMAPAFLSGLSLSFERFTNQSTNVVRFEQYDVKPERAVDILNYLVVEYNREFKQEMSLPYQHSLEVIDARLKAPDVTESEVLHLQELRGDVLLSMSTISDRMMVVEPAAVSAGTPTVSRRKVMTAALLAGLLLPVAAVLVRSLLRTRVETKEDVRRKLHRKVLGILPKSEAKVSSLNDSRVNESFGMLRNDLKTVGGRVFQVTSSTEGEGKTFVAANLALSLSQLPQRVALLELDFRHTSLDGLFPEEAMGVKQSIADFLSQQCDNPALIPVTCSRRAGAFAEKGQLDVFFAGRTPSNPSALLSLDRMQSLVDYCRANYDYVICDTPSFMPLADASIVNRYVDAALYVVRCDFTKLVVLPEVRELLGSGRLRETYVLLNAFDAKARKYRYGYRRNNYFCQ